MSHTYFITTDEPLVPDNIQKMLDDTRRFLDYPNSDGFSSECRFCGEYPRGAWHNPISHTEDCTGIRLHKFLTNVRDSTSESFVGQEG